MLVVVLANVVAQLSQLVIRPITPICIPIIIIIMSRIMMMIIRIMMRMMLWMIMIVDHNQT